MLMRVYVFTFQSYFVSGSETCVFLVGNKNDLDDDAWAVSHEEALSAAKSRHCCFVETSAASTQGLHTLFVGILSKMFRVSACPSIPRKWTWLLRKLPFGKFGKRKRNFTEPTHGLAS